MALINDNGVERLPIVREGDTSQEVVGILSQRDIISAYDQALEARGLKEMMLTSPR
jgi:CBS domain-containing protein